MTMADARLLLHRLDRRSVPREFPHSVGLALSSLITYVLTMTVLAHIHSISRDDDLLGGMWAVVATVFVYRSGYAQSLPAALSRSAATLVSFGLCLAYLLFLPFTPWGMAILIGLGALIMGLSGRPDDIITAGITTAVVMVVAGISPDNAWQVPILRLADTFVGIVVGLAAAWAGLRLTSRVSS